VHDLGERTGRLEQGHLVIVEALGLLNGQQEATTLVLRGLTAQQAVAIQTLQRLSEQQAGMGETLRRLEARG